MRPATTWMCLAALALSACGEPEDVETSSAFEQLAASVGTEIWVDDGEDDCRRRVVQPRAIVVRDAPCEGIDLRGAAAAAVSDRLAIAAVTRNGPGEGWIFEASVRTVVERKPAERVKVVKKKVRVRSKKGRKGKGRRPVYRVKRIRRTVTVRRPPVHRTVHVRCTDRSVALDLFDDHGPVRALSTEGVSCGTDGRVVEVVLPLGRFFVPGAKPAVVGRVTASLARRAEDRSRVRDVLDRVVRVRLDVAECDNKARAGPAPGSEVRCPPWSSPSSSAP